MTDYEQKMIFASNLNALLLKYEKTQLEVAESIDVSPQTFNTWCKGKALPRMGKVQKLADYFGVNKSDLIDRKDINSDQRALSPAAVRLLSSFHNLNPEGQEKVIEYAQLLDQSGAYNIYHEFELLEKEA